MDLQQFKLYRLRCLVKRRLTMDYLGFEASCHNIYEYNVATNLQIDSKITGRESRGACRQDELMAVKHQS
jgi:hypothetical protein